MSKIFLEQIFEAPRIYREVPFFSQPTNTCLLSFIGAADYFITDFGLIWNRKKVYTNREGKLCKYFQPWVYRDTVYVHPWSLIPTTAGPVWFPILQLLGWAFYPINEPTKKYFLPAQEQLMPYKACDCQWSELPPIQNPRSRYLKWIDQIYS